MATPTDIVSATVTLRAGVSDATLPNNVKMRYGYNYAIPLEDLAKISQNARTTVIEEVVFNTAAHIVPGYNMGDYFLDLSALNNYSTMALLNADEDAAKVFVLGETIRGFQDTAFKLVRVDASSGAVTAGTVVLWGGVDPAPYSAAEGKLNSTVTSDYSDVVDDYEFAGVAIGTITAGNYGWIQVAGIAYATKVETGTLAGEAVAASEDTDGVATCICNEVQDINLGDVAPLDTYKIATAAAQTNKTATLTYEDTDGGDAHGGQIETALTAVLGVDNVQVENTYVYQVITLAGIAPTDSFKLTVFMDGFTATETVAFVAGTNMTAAAIQAALRTATGDTALTVTGTTDLGPFEVIFINTALARAITVTSPVAMTGSVGSITFQVTFMGALSNLDVPLLEITDEVGFTGDAVIQTREGSSGLGSNFGSAITTEDTGTANVQIRGPLARNLKGRHRDLFRDAQN